MKFWGIIEDSQKRRIINTTLSVKGSKTIPNFYTKLYFLATIPSIESDKPIAAIITTKIYTLKFSGR